MKTLLTIFTILSVVVYSHAAVVKSLEERIECFRGVQTRIYEDRIRELLDDLRNKLKEGIPDKNIPAMDPFVMDNWNLKINEPFAKLDWTMNGKIAGIMDWKVSDLKFNLAGLKFSGVILIPKIAGKGSYKIDGSIAEVLPVYGSGDFDVLAENLEFNITGKIGTRETEEEQHLFMEYFSVGTALEKFSFGVSGLMDDEPLNTLLSQAISENLPDLIESFQSQIDAVVSSKVTTLADEVLVNMTTDDIINMLKPATTTEASVFNIHCGYPSLP